MNCDHSILTKMKRLSGILVHPTSLPGEFGIGDLGPEAYRFVDFLQNAGQHLWQTLPVGPTGQFNCPYQCYSSFAGQPLLISPQLLVEDHLLKEENLSDHPDFPELNQVLGEIGERYGVPKTAVAIAWILRHPAHMQAIAGTMNPEHLKDICMASKVHLTHQEWYRLYLSAGKFLP